jgi:hypothetical protein
MYDSSGDSNGCHRLSRRLKDQASVTRVQLGFPDYRGQPGHNPTTGARNLGVLVCEKRVSGDIDSLD